MNNKEIVRRIDLAQHADRAMHLICHLEALKKDLLEEVAPAEEESAKNVIPIIEAVKAQFCLCKPRRRCHSCAALDAVICDLREGK